MRLIVGGRQTGKTETLIRMAQEAEGVVIVPTVSHIASLVTRYGSQFTIDHVLTPNEMIQRKWLRDAPIFIDNVEEILETMLLGLRMRSVGIEALVFDNPVETVRPFRAD